MIFNIPQGSSSKTRRLTTFTQLFAFRFVTCHKIIKNFDKEPTLSSTCLTETQTEGSIQTEERVSLCQRDYSS